MFIFVLSTQGFSREVTKINLLKKAFSVILPHFLINPKKLLTETEGHRQFTRKQKNAIQNTLRVICEFFKLNHENVMTNCVGGSHTNEKPSFKPSCNLMFVHQRSVFIVNSFAWSFYIRVA